MGFVDEGALRCSLASEDALERRTPQGSLRGQELSQNTGRGVGSEGGSRATRAPWNSGLPARPWAATLGPGTWHLLVQERQMKGERGWCLVSSFPLGG